MPRFADLDYVIAECVSCNLTRNKRFLPCKCSTNLRTATSC